MSRAYSQLGYTFYNLGEFPEAGTALRKAIALEPRSVDANLYMGIINRLGRPGQCSGIHPESIGAAARECNRNLLRGLHCTPGWTLAGGTRASRGRGTSRAQ